MLFVPSGIQGNGFWINGYAAGQYPAFPKSAVENGDTYLIESETVEMRSSSGGPVTISFPAPWNYPGPIPDELPLFTNLGYTGFTGSGTEAVVLEADLSDSSDWGEDYILSTSRSAMHRASTLTFPDLSYIPGFLAGARPGEYVRWSATLSQSTYGFLQPISANGTVASVKIEGYYAGP